MKHEHIAVIILAAGGSKRMGFPKQLLRYKGQTLLNHIAKVAASSLAKATYVVLGAKVDRLSKEIINLKVEAIENQRWQEGLSTSIRMGIMALPQDVKAAIVTLSDQPGVTYQLLNSLITTYQTTGNTIVACEYGGTLGAPALFDRQHFPALCALTGDSGAKEVIMNHLHAVAKISFPEGEIDIDNPSDYEALNH